MRNFKAICTKSKDCTLFTLSLNLSHYSIFVLTKLKNQDLYSILT